ncbi:MAG: hypothetical protein CUN57_01920, partial [Phototrophicales bacterium]
MRIIKPVLGVNLRQRANDINDRQAAFMQNIDMRHDEIFSQIHGSVKYHGSALGTVAPSAVIPHYDNTKKIADVLACCDGLILKKNFGSNEFETVLSGITPGAIRFGVGIDNKTFLASRKDGLFRFLDGACEKINDIKLRDIVASKET